MANELIDKIKDGAAKNFNKERWIWIVLASGISTMWIAYNSNTEREIGGYREEIQIKRQDVKECETLNDKKNAEIIALYREISGLEDKLKKDKKQNNDKNN